MNPSDLRRRFNLQLAQLEAQGYEVRPLIFEPPASHVAISKLEQDLGFILPFGFRRVLEEVSSHVQFRWFAPKGHQFPAPFGSNFSGDLHWSLNFTRQFNRDKQGWIDSVFKNPNDKYDAVWHNKLVFFEVGNGDYLALDLAEERSGQVVYLSHDDGIGHGRVLAPSFDDLLQRWTPLACPGGEDWQWLPFTSSEFGFIDPSTENARSWRRLLNLDA